MENKIKNDELKVFFYEVKDSLLIFLTIDDFKNPNTRVFLQIFREINNKINITFVDPLGK